MGNFALLSLVAALATSALAEPISQAWRPTETGISVVRRQDVPDDCTFFEIPASEEEDCEFFASRWGITVEEFISWVSLPRFDVGDAAPESNTANIRTLLLAQTAVASRLERSTVSSGTGVCLSRRQAQRPPRPPRGLLALQSLVPHSRV